MWSLKFLKLIFLIINFNFILNDYEIIEIEDFFNEMDSIKKTPEEYKKIINSFKTIFQSYVFLDIAKSPPKIEEIENYHTPYDLINEFDKINTDETDFYTFYGNITSATCGKTKDGHIAIDFINKEISLYNAFFVFPIIPVVDKGSDGEIKMYAQMSLEEENYEYFKNGNYLLNILKKNINEPIKNLNGQDPFDFITDFFDEYQNLRSKHATYTSIFNSFPVFYFYLYPISKDNLNNFTIEFENGDKVSTDLLIMKKVSNNLKLNNLKKIK